LPPSGDVPPGGVARGHEDVLRVDYEASSAGCATSSAGLAPRARSEGPT
jgi:hypothetical protein